MMDDDPVTHLHVSHARSHLRYHATRFMPSSLELRWVILLRLGCSITVEVAATQSRSSHLHDCFKEIRLGIGKFFQLHFAFAEKYDSSHVNLFLFFFK
jgi:hypothetical protein